MAQEYYTMGINLLKAKSMLNEGYFHLEKAQNVSLKNIPNFIVYEIFEMQQVYSNLFLKNLSSKLDSEELETYFKDAKIRLTNEDLI